MGMKRAIRLAGTTVAFLAVASAASAQEVRTINPGMTADEVRSLFGQPDGTSARGQFIYWFFNNGCERECGFPDLVIFQAGQVVDAVLRAPWNEYGGESSSPKGAIPRPTPGGERLQVPPTGEVEGVEIRPAVPPARVEEADTVKADTTGVRQTRRL